LVPRLKRVAENAIVTPKLAEIVPADVKDKSIGDPTDKRA
jgi:hypothetical protein